MTRIIDWFYKLYQTKCQVDAQLSQVVRISVTPKFNPFIDLLFEYDIVDVFPINRRKEFQFLRDFAQNQTKYHANIKELIQQNVLLGNGSKGSWNSCLSTALSNLIKGFLKRKKISNKSINAIDAQVEKIAGHGQMTILKELNALSVIKQEIEKSIAIINNYIKSAERKYKCACDADKADRLAKIDSFHKSLTYLLKEKQHFRELNVDLQAKVSRLRTSINNQDVQRRGIIDNFYRNLFNN